MKRRNMKVMAQSQEDPKTIPFVNALANKVLSMIGFVDFIGRNVDMDPYSVVHIYRQPGQSSCSLSTLFDIRALLSNIDKRFEGMDTEAIFRPGTKSEQLKR